MEAVSLLGLLGICSYEDIKTREIEVISVLCFGILGFILHLFTPSRPIGDILAGMSVGVLMFVISLISRERIGKGDALILTVSGIYLGFWNNLILLWGASFLAGIVGVVLLARGKRRCQIPFVPFLLGVYLIILATGLETFVS